MSGFSNIVEQVLSVWHITYGPYDTPYDAPMSFKPNMLTQICSFGIRSSIKSYSASDLGIAKNAPLFFPKFIIWYDQSSLPRKVNGLPYEVNLFFEKPEN